MPAKIPQLKALLQQLEGEHKEIGRKMEEVRIKIKDKTKKSRDAQSQRKKKQKKEKKKTGSPKSVAITDIAATTVDAETQNVAPETSEVKAERQEETQHDNKVVMIWTKANEAKASAEEAVQELKSLRKRGKARSEEITAARVKVKSRKRRATELELVAILTEDELQETFQRGATTKDTTIVHEAHGSVEEDYATPFICDDNDSLSPWASPSAELNDLFIAPEIFPLPTPITTNTSPTTNPTSPIKEEASPVKGTKDEPFIVDDATKDLYQNDRAYDRRLKANYEKELSARNPTAELIAEYIKISQDNGPIFFKSIKITEYTLMTLLEDMWLDDDILNYYIELVVQKDPRFQVISSTKISWELDSLNRQGGPQESYPVFDMEPNTQSLLIPGFVNNNHWMLCVANLPNASSRAGTLEWYDSMGDAVYQRSCEAYAGDVIRVLLWLATIPNSPLCGVSWKLNECKSGRQRNSNDCGVFVAANATAVVHNAPIPQHVKGFRMQIASQVVKAARGDILDWTTIKDMLVLAEEVEASQAGDDSGDVDDGKDEGNIEMIDVECEDIEESNYVCDICWYHNASSPETLAIHKSGKHNTQPFLCEWPGCRAVMVDQASLDKHHGQIHERKTYWCPMQTCYLRFVTKDEWRAHVGDQHPEMKDINPSILAKRYRTFDLADMRLSRENHQRIWEINCKSKEEEHFSTAKLYAAYHSRTVREYFSNRGLLGQSFDPVESQCRIVSRSFEKAEDQSRPRMKYCLRTKWGKLMSTWGWFLLLLHQPEGSELDKFIFDTLISWVHLSHKFHWAWCFVISHLERELPDENDDRTSCKNRSRRLYGGCNALTSRHPFNHCLLDLPKGDAFDLNLPPPPRGKVTALKAPRGKSADLQAPRGKATNLQATKRKAPKPLSRTDTSKRPKTLQPELTGPCANGHKTSLNNEWHEDLFTSKRVLCGMCWLKAMKRLLYR